MILFLKIQHRHFHNEDHVVRRTVAGAFRNMSKDIMDFLKIKVFFSIRLELQI